MQVVVEETRNWQTGKQNKQAFADVLQNSSFKNFAIFTGWHMCYWSLSLLALIAFKPVTLLKGVSNTGAFLWMLQKF